MEMAPCESDPLKTKNPPFSDYNHQATTKTVFQFRSIFQGAVKMTPKRRKECKMASKWRPNSNRGDAPEARGAKGLVRL